EITQRRLVPDRRVRRRAADAEVLTDALALKVRPDVRHADWNKVRPDAAIVGLDLGELRMSVVVPDEGALRPGLPVAEGVILRDHSGDGVLAQQAKQPVRSVTLVEIVRREGGGTHALPIGAGAALAVADGHERTARADVRRAVEVPAVLRCIRAVTPTRMRSEE